MASVADDLRRRNARLVLDMPVNSRILLALSLGDDDLAIFASTNGLDRREAAARLRVQRARGRRVSIAAAPAREP
jgi:hypothetical protein